MALTSEQFIDLLEQHEVVSPSHIDSLREQIAAADPPMHPHFIARRLVQMGYLNSYFAKNLLAVGSGVKTQSQPGEEYELAPLEEELSDEFAALEADSDFQDLELNLPPLEDFDLQTVPAAEPVLRPTVQTSVQPLANPAAHRREKPKSNIPLPLKLAMGAAILVVLFLIGMIAAEVFFGL